MVQDKSDKGINNKIRSRESELIEENPGRGSGSLESMGIRENIADLLSGAPISDVEEYLDRHDVIIGVNDDKTIIRGIVEPKVKIGETIEGQEYRTGISYKFPVRVSPKKYGYYEFGNLYGDLTYTYMPGKSEHLSFYLGENLLGKASYNDFSVSEYEDNQITKQVSDIGGKSLLNLIYNINEETKLISPEHKKNLVKEIKWKPRNPETRDKTSD